MVENSFGDFTCYYKSPFFGRDSGQEERTNLYGQTKVYSWKSAPGLTQWVADNFEVLGFDAPAPSEERRVNEENRDIWAPFALEYL
ncbi:MAG: hypothetical protein CMB56_002075, partial [Methanobacteriota archaeon]